MIVTVEKNKVHIEEYPNKDFIKVTIDVPFEKMEFHGDTLDEMREFLEE